MEDFEVQATGSDPDVSEQLNMSSRKKKRLTKRANRKQKKADKLNDKAGNNQDQDGGDGAIDTSVDVMNQPDASEVVQQNQDIDQIVEQGMQDATTDVPDDDSTMIIGFDAQEKLGADGGKKGKKDATDASATKPGSAPAMGKGTDKVWYKKPITLIVGGVAILGLGILAFVKFGKKKK